MKYIDVEEMRVVTNDKHMRESVCGEFGKVGGEQKLKSIVMDGVRSGKEDKVKNVVMGEVKTGKVGKLQN